MFSCPDCQCVVGEYPTAGVLAVVCAGCTFKYELSGGVARACTSRQVQVRAATEQQRASYARQYELTLAVSSRETLRFTFGTARDDEWIRIGTGDACVVVYSMRGEEREELLFIVNRTSGERFILGTPGSRSKFKANLIGGIIGVGVLGLGAVAPIPFAVALGLAAASGFGAAMGMAHVLKPKHVLRLDEQVTLSARQSLLDEKRTVLRRREEVAAEVDTRQSLRKRLFDLKTRMEAVKVDAYAPRIELIDKALASLEAQLDVDHRLVAEYERTLQIIDIEYESSVAADAMPGDGAGIMEARLTELRSVEEHRAETTRQLSANAEVEQLLRSHSGDPSSLTK
ncbi:MAG: hypothetical protein JWM95_4351 [Gemmatimonadetes bacterium]|nr:hypothetical protein [Gemmatimonadota bacterium]